MPDFAVILPAAGRSSRYHDENYKKQFAMLENRSVWLYSAERFTSRHEVKQVLLVISEEDWDSFHQKFGANIAFMGITVVKGGSERSDSIHNAIKKLMPSIEYVCVHDAARPCLADIWIDEVFSQSIKTGAAMLAIPVTDTLKKVEHGVVTATVPRHDLWAAQTPQVFRRDWLEAAYAARAASSVPITDDAQLIEAQGHNISIITGSPMNIKLTTKSDLKLASAILKILPRPKLDNPIHPFGDNDMWR